MAEVIPAVITVDVKAIELAEKAVTELLIEYDPQRKIISQQECDMTNVVLKKFANARKHFVAERDGVLAPFKEMIKHFKEGLDPGIKRIEEAISAGKKAILEWEAYLEEKDRQAEAARQKEIETREKQREAAKERGFEVKDDPIEQRVAKPVSLTRSSTTSYRKNWRFRIIDQAKVPEAYKLVDSITVNLAIREAKAKADKDKAEFALEIDGLEFYQEKIAVIR